MKSWKRRYFVLNKDDKTLTYFESREMAAFGQNTCKGTIHLTEAAQIKDALDLGSSNKHYGFGLQIPGRLYVLAAKDPDERSSWLHALRAVLGVRGHAKTEGMQNSSSSKDASSSSRRRKGSVGKGGTSRSKGSRAHASLLPVEESKLEAEVALVEGDLLRQSSGLRKKWEEVSCRLTSLYLTMSNHQTDKEEKLFITYNTSVVLRGVMKGIGHVFQIDTDKDKVVLAAANTQDLEKWLGPIQRVVQIERQKREKLFHPTSSSAAHTSLSHSEEAERGGHGEETVLSSSQIKSLFQSVFEHHGHLHKQSGSKWRKRFVVCDRTSSSLFYWHHRGDAVPFAEARKEEKEWNAKPVQSWEGKVRAYMHIYICANI